MRLVRRLIPALVLASLAGCTARETSSAPRRDRSLITRDEVEASHSLTAYDMVQTLRPAWLRVRGTTTLQYQEQVIVYVNGVRTGGVDALRQIRPDAIESIRHLDEVQATARYGPGHAAGAILVSLLVGT